MTEKFFVTSDLSDFNFGCGKCWRDWHIQSDRKPPISPLFKKYFQPLLDEINSTRFKFPTPKPHYMKHRINLEGF